MSVTAPTKFQTQYPTNPANATALKAFHDAVTTAANAGTLTANALSADSTGRAVMATGYFNEATATAKFAAGAIVGTLLKAGALAADATGRALMATGYFTEAKATDAFAAQAITSAIIKDANVTATQLGAGAVTEPKMSATILTGKHMATTAAGNTVPSPILEFIITVADGSTVLDAVTVDATYGKFQIQDVHVIKTGSTGSTTDAVQLCTDSGGTTAISSSLALNTVAAGGVVRTTSITNATINAGAHLYVKRTKTTDCSVTMLVKGYRIA